MQTAPEMRAKPILVGITIAGDLRLASIIEPALPGMPANEARRAHTRRVGDVYQGYTIVGQPEADILIRNARGEDPISISKAPLREERHRSWRLE